MCHHGVHHMVTIRYGQQTTVHNPHKQARLPAAVLPMRRSCKLVNNPNNAEQLIDVVHNSYRHVRPKDMTTAWPAYLNRTSQHHAAQQLFMSHSG
jgi:hypothetical protein